MSTPGVLTCQVLTLKGDQMLVEEQSTANLYSSAHKLGYTVTHPLCGGNDEDDGKQVHTTT